MVTSETRAHAAFDAATRRIAATVATVSGQLATVLGGLAATSLRVADRDLLNLTQFELRRGALHFQAPLLEALREKVVGELAPRSDAGRTLASRDWQHLSLVDEAEMEGRLYADRIGQAISHACDAELRDLAAYIAGLLPAGHADADRHPLRPELLGALVYRGVESVSREPAQRKILAREFGRLLEKAMPGCYAAIVGEWQSLGLRPAALVARGVDRPGVGGGARHTSFGGMQTQTGDFSRTTSMTGFDSGSTFGGSRRHGTGSGTSSRGPTDLADPSTPGRGFEADAALMSLLRRLTAVASAPSGLAALSGFGGPAAARASGYDTSAGAAGHASGPFGIPAVGDSAPAPLMAVNLIREHRDELVKASTGQLDHMVIDVVGSLFDQILSDTRVPPQMARQIARLQLPVLRVALADTSFFSSRRHPVRRFVNRMASLACAFDDFDAGPGLQFIDRVRRLVQEIVEGDFDQIDLYTAKLAELERFIDEQTGAVAARGDTAVTLDRKEGELRVQQRCRLRLQAALAPVEMPPWMRDFLEQVWSQALVLAAAAVGGDADRLQRYRRAGRDIVLSVQPKGSPAMRKRFLMQLPPLMRDLQDGMTLVGWPEAAQRDFRGLLLPAHADSMKLAPLSELEHNLLAKQLESIFAAAGAEPLTSSVDEPLDTAAPEPRFSPEEALAVGLVPESTVDWSSPVELDIDLSAETQPGADAGPSGSHEIDIALDLRPTGHAAEPPEPTAGPALMDHVKLGFAYQMHLQDAWQKVRLTHVSAGRGFFVFSRGKDHQETISMTARMLARMCESGRIRAVESAYLMERATQRARRQLAAMRPAPRAAVG